MRKFLDKISKKHYMQCLLAIILTEGILELTKSFWHNNDMQIDWCRLIIFTAVAFMLMYKFVQYLSKFKIEKNHSRIDIVFLAVFFVLLFLPMSNISDALKSKYENRMLAKKPQLTMLGNGLNDYGEKFNAWYNDRFFGRNLLILLHSSLNFIIPRYVENKLAIKLPDDMIFNKVILKRLINPIKHTELEKISQNIAKLQKFAKQNNIELYIMIPPAKEDLYLDSLQNIYADINPQRNVIKDLQKYILEKNKLEIIYPRDVYLNSYKDFTHYKTDHHWTEFGAFLGYQRLIENIRQKHPDIISLSEDDFDVFYKNKPRYGNFKDLFNRPFYDGSGCKLLGVRSLCPLSYKYKYYEHKNRANLKVKLGPMNMSRITHYNNGLDVNVTLLGNSYGGFLMEFLPYNFQNVQYLRVNNAEKGVTNVYDMKRFEKYILDFRTDILIFYLASSYFNDFTNLYKED